MRISDWSSDVCSSDLLNYSQYGISFDARYHFIAEGRSWNPYLLAGLGYQRAEGEFDNFPNPDSPIQREDSHVAGKLGVGVQSTFDKRVAIQIGRASCRESVCQYVKISVGGGSIK